MPATEAEILAKYNLALGQVCLFRMSRATRIGHLASIHIVPDSGGEAYALLTNGHDIYSDGRVESREEMVVLIGSCLAAYPLAVSLTPEQAIAADARVKRVFGAHLNEIKEVVAFFKKFSHAELGVCLARSDEGKLAVRLHGDLLIDLAKDDLANLTIVGCIDRLSLPKLREHLRTAAAATE